MNNKLISTLNRPFPIIETVKQKLLVSFLFAVFIYIFLIVFQPFGLSEIQFYKPLYVAGFFVITFLVMLVSFFVGPLILKKAFNPDKWTVKKEIYFILWIINLIAIFNWLYNSTVGEEISEQYNLLTFLFITIAVGIIPTIFVTFYIEHYLANKHDLISRELTGKIQRTDNESHSGKVKIVSDNNADLLTLNLHDFICVVSEGNYANVFYQDNSEIKKKLIRNSLSKLNEQFIIFDTIMRCHRSYIVNLQNVKRVSGNARNYNLHVNKLDFTIPVSRNFPKSIIKNI